LGPRSVHEALFGSHRRPDFTTFGVKVTGDLIT
jgi:hypothetical protein